jgi:MFS family permease
LPSIASLLGLEHPTEKAIHLVRKMAFLRIVITAVFEVSTTWFIIFIAETLGEGDYFAGLTLLGVLVIIRSGIQTVVDYPSGTLGDRFGQRHILASGLFCYSLAYWLISTITIETSFTIFIALYVLLAFGASQMSGALESWFDNNYRFAMPSDTERKGYGVLMGRFGMLVKLSAILVIIPGSWLATSTSRILVFYGQSIFCIILTFVVLFVVRDFPELKDTSEEIISDKTYTTLLMDGLRFLRSDPFITLTIIGEVLLVAVFFTFWMIVYYPFLFYFLLTDVAVSSYRTVGILSAAVEQERSGIWSKRFSPVKWIPRFRFLASSLFYLSFALIVFVFPDPTIGDSLIQVYLPFTELAIIEIPSISLFPVILTLIVFTITGFLGSFADILTQRIYLDIIPDQIRNSWYSLKPTLRTIFMLPLVLIAGWIAPEFGLPTTFVFFFLIASIGALLIRRGFGFPIPETEQ